MKNSDLYSFLFLQMSSSTNTNSGTFRGNSRNGNAVVGRGRGGRGGSGGSGGNTINARGGRGASNRNSGVHVRNAAHNQYHNARGTNIRLTKAEVQRLFTKERSYLHRKGEVSMIFN